MSKAGFRIAYDGEMLSSHTMDVRDLAPALMGLGEIFVEANHVLNGTKANVEIHVTPKIEKNCFDIGLEVFQSWQMVKDLLGSPDITTAKELVEWVALNKEVVGGGFGGLFWLYKQLRGKRPVNVIRFNDENGNRLYRYQFNDAPDKIVDERSHQLYKSQKIRKQLSRLWRPLIKHSGVTEFRVYESDEESKEIKLSKTEVLEIDFTESESLDSETLDALSEPIQVWLRVYSPVYDMNAPRWRFWYKDDHHYMDVSDSNIRDVVHRAGGALIDDAFRVWLQISKHESDTGDLSEEYRVLEVLEFKPANRQTDIFMDVSDVNNTDNQNDLDN